MAKRKTYAGPRALKTKGPTTKVPFNKSHTTSLASAGGTSGSEGHPHHPNGHHVQKITKRADTSVDGNHVFHVKGRMPFPEGGCHITSLESPNIGIRSGGAVAPAQQAKGSWIKSPSTPQPCMEQRPPTESHPVRQHHQLAELHPLKVTK